MQNYLKTWVYNVKDYFTFLSQSEIFDIAEKSVSFFWGEWTSTPSLHKKDASRYLWKMLKEKEGRDKKLYNDDFIIFSLAYVFKHSFNEKKVVVRIWRAISELANGKEDVAEYMSLEEEKQHILSLAKRYFPERYKQLVIIDMEEDNPELFKTLRETWITWLDSEQQPQLGDNTTSLDIAKYLYWACKKNKKFYGWIKKLMAEDQIKKTENNYPSYYGLIEISCRLHDFLKWICIQWWAARQNLYDEFIMMILGDIKGIERFPELKPLHDFCVAKSWQKTFGRMYIYKDIYKKLLESKKNILKSRNRYLKIIWWISSSLLLLLWGIASWYYLSNQKQKADQEQRSEEYQKKSLMGKHSNKAFFDGFELRESDGTRRLIRKIDESTNAFYDDFIQIYGTGNAEQKDLDALKRLMKQYFLQADTNGKLINIDKVYSPFLDYNRLHSTLREFVSLYGQFLIDSKLDVIPQPNMQEYKSACKYTLELKGNIQANYCVSNSNELLNIESDSTLYQKKFDELIKELKEDWLWMNLPRHTFNVHRYGHYLHNDGTHYDVLIVQYEQDKKFLLASELSWYDIDHFSKEQVHDYSKTNWEKVAKDVLENRQVSQ